jgi:hypothetical protein
MSGKTRKRAGTARSEVPVRFYFKPLPAGGKSELGAKIENPLTLPQSLLKYSHKARIIHAPKTENR